jgi:plastocyanin
LFSDQDLFIDWSVVNTSLATGITAPFQTHLFVDGISKFFWTHDPLPPDTFHQIFDKNIGKLSAGEHIVRIWTDVTSLVDESDENDNQYQKVITVKARSGQTHRVQFRDFQFDPPALTIKVGDTVRFENSGGDHTVTGTGADPFCGTGAIPASCQVKFNTPGSYPYRCIFHSSAGPPAQGMAGTITVEAQGSVLTLQSSATVEGPYGTDSTASIDAATQTVRLPLPLASRYFRLIGPNAVRITSIRIVGDQLEIGFQAI